MKPTEKKCAEILHINASPEFLANPEKMRIIQDMANAAYNKPLKCPKCKVFIAKGGGCINHSDCPLKPIKHL